MYILYTQYTQLIKLAHMDVHVHVYMYNLMHVNVHVHVHVYTCTLNMPSLNGLIGWYLSGKPQFCQ